MTKYIQSLSLVRINDIPVTNPTTHSELIDSDSDESIDFFMPLNLSACSELDSEHTSDYGPPIPPLANLAPSTGKRGRKKLTDAERAVADILKKEYFKTYYRENPSKYKYDTYDYSNSCIYKLTHTKTNKVYIGSTILPLNMRLKRHASCIRNPTNSTYKDMAAVSRSGWTIEPMVKVKLESKQMLNYLETIYISHYQDTVFNRNKKYSPDVIECVSVLFHADYLPAPRLAV